jgi:hypothetical protein
MRRVLCLIFILFTFSLLISCASQTRYIEIKEDDVIHEYGIPKFEVYPGDTLKILATKTCRSGSGICYKVKKVQTGEIGYVSKERMEKKHKIYTLEE